jgi:hypothetical protein
MKKNKGKSKKNLFGIFTYSVLFLILLSSSVFGQTKTCVIPIMGNGDTTLSYKWQQGYALQMGLADLIKSNDSLHFRFWTETQSIDIWTNDFTIFKGLLSNYTRSIIEDKIKKGITTSQPGKFFSSFSTIDSATAKQVYKLFEENFIFKIPTGDSIEGWGNGLDGTELLIEHSTPTAYSFKEYWSPSAFKKIKEAVTIDELSKQLESLLKMNESWAHFIDGLPIGCYYAGGIFHVCKKREKKKT